MHMWWDSRRRTSESKQISSCLTNLSNRSESFNLFMFSLEHFISRFLVIVTPGTPRTFFNLYISYLILQCIHMGEWLGNYDKKVGSLPWSKTRGKLGYIFRPPGD